MMPYRYLEGLTVADLAFEVTADTYEELLVDSAKAVTNAMIRNMEILEPKIERTASITALDEELLLFNWLDEIIFWKDTEGLLFKEFDISVDENENRELVLTARMRGEELDMKRMELVIDVKAPTMHHFDVYQNDDGKWHAVFIVDI